MLKRFGMVASVLALLVLTLAGCKNGMLGEDEATVNGLRDAGDRTARVTITNFAGDGKMRTITPDSIDLAASAGDYVFVATGTNNRVPMDAAIVPVDGVSGRVDLSGLNPGTWTITITAYSVQLLNGEGVTLTDVNAVMAEKDTCAVLSGTGYVDLRNSSSDVKITLTPAGMGTEGNVDVKLNLHTEDQTKIQTNRYTVKIGVYNGSTLVNGYEADVSTTAQAQREIRYTQKLPVGLYVLKVSITDTVTGKGPWVWSDHIYVEGNRDTAPVTPIDMEKLIGEAPKPPKNFAVYYDTDTVNSNTGSYTATFAWDRDSHNEQGFKLQIYDITDKYDYTGGVMQYDSQTFTSAENLWTVVNQNQDKDTKGLKTKETMGTDVTYPKYAGGNLMAASTYVDYTLQTGHVYVFRLQAENTAGDSEWVYFTGTGTEPTSKNTHPANATLNRLDQNVAGVFTVTYDLQDTFVLAAENDTLDTASINTTTEPVVYKPGTPYDILYLPRGNFLLFKTGATGNADNLNPNYVAGWTGWTDAYDNAVQFTDAKSTYDKWGNLTLTTIGGASGKSSMLDIISSGTFGALLNGGNKVLLKLEQNPATVTWQAAQQLTAYTGDVKAATDGFGKVNTSFALNIDTDGGNTTRYLYFTVGEDVGTGNIEAGKLKTANGRDVVVDEVKLTLEENGKISARGMGTPVGFVDLNGLQSGDYTLRIVATNTHGYTFTYQTQLTVKYDTDVIQ